MITRLISGNHFFMRQEILTWEDVDRLIDDLIPQFDLEFDCMLMITSGGIIPGGMLAEALKLTSIYTASVDFPAETHNNESQSTHPYLSWPKFIQFPDDSLLTGNRILIVDDVWGSGRTITAIRNRVSSAGGVAYTCVLHFNPYRNLFGTMRPNYYAATTDAHIIYPWEANRGKARTIRLG
jgi:hypoxanthine phosphoribosyltransferase